MSAQNCRLNADVGFTVKDRYCNFVLFFLISIRIVRQSFIICIYFPKQKEQRMDLEEKHSKYIFDHLTAISSTSALCDYRNFICVTADRHTEHIYVVKEGHYDSIKLFIFSMSGTIVKEFIQEGLRYPLGIAFHQNNLYITLLNAPFLVHLKLTDDLDLKKIKSREDIGSGLNHKFNKFGQFRRVAVATNGDVFVTELERNRIQILDRDLNYKSKISHYSIINPVDVKVKGDEVFILSFNLLYYRYCILVFNQMGHKLRSVIFLGLNKHVSRFHWKHFSKSPFHYPVFCLDSNGNFIINDVETDIIKFFTEKGTLFQKFGKSGVDPGMFSSITGLILTTNQKLVVVSMIGQFKLDIFLCLILNVYTSYSIFCPMLLEILLCTCGELQSLNIIINC